ncbi:uncharacterized protein LOC125206495 [Salvia hispanica]|uniref:uncharacterized protein LOC125206495 n=1 Tax=Salvia hispanica TaxID=49212 RepID=UPI0020096AB0|nr:uncharacterized protein LOC125206495 [Salvia hispanica]
MVGFGDELIIESYKIPWLIWIQLLITILLFLLFFGFAAFTYDASTRSAAPPSGHQPAANNFTSPNGIMTVEDERAGGRAGSSGGSSREEEDESSLKDTVILGIFRRPTHPCNYFGRAKQAIFKCFGLDSSSESSASQQHEKQD